MIVAHSTQSNSSCKTLLHVHVPRFTVTLDVDSNPSSVSEDLSEDRNEVCEAREKDYDTEAGQI